MMRFRGFQWIHIPLSATLRESELSKLMPVATELLGLLENRLSTVGNRHGWLITYELARITMRLRPYKRTIRKAEAISRLILDQDSHGAQTVFVELISLELHYDTHSKAN